MKTKSIWYCSSCGHSQARWSGQCSTCSGWNTFQEEVESPKRNLITASLSSQKNSKPVFLSEIEDIPLTRFTTCFQEFDKAVGGGIVPGSLILVGGDPGIGKSTLCLHLASSIGDKENPVLYISGEESLEQIAIRARRLNVPKNSILFSNETELNAIAHLLQTYNPKLVIIDSIQILYKNEIPSAQGSVTQVRECTAALMQIAKATSTAMLIIGHVTKSGEIAGPRVLEHLVDTVLYFEGDQQQNLRLIRSIKNRFGPTDEIAVFQMDGGGLKEVLNPSQLFIEDRTRGTTGTVITPMMEGTRPILIEAQALVTETFFPTPSRRSTGIDSNRLALLLAVCEKRARLRLHQSDVFVSVTGGMKVTEPAVDLGLLLAIVSSFANKVFDQDTAVMGEVGLSGEVRGVPRIEARVKEALQMGFSRCIVPAKNFKAVHSMQESIKIVPVSWIDEALDLII
jgi:DNA repair protein RadA/Sms